MSEASETPRFGAPSREAKTGLVAIAGLGSQQLAALAIALCSAVVLSPSEFGTFALAAICIELVTALLFTGFFNFAVTSDEPSETLLNTSFWMMQGLAAAGVCVLFFAAPGLASLLDVPQLTSLIRWLILVLPIIAYVAWSTAVLTRQARMNTLYGAIAAENLVGLAFGLVLLMVWQSVFALVAYRLIRAVCALVAFGVALPTRPKPIFDTGIARRAARYASSLMAGRALDFSATFGVDFILAYWLSTREVGLYRLAHQLATGAVSLIGQPMRNFALAQFGAAHRNGAPLAPVVRRFVLMMALFMGAAAISVTFLAKPLFALAFDPAFGAALGLIGFLALRLVSQLGPAVLVSLSSALGHPLVSFVFQSISAVLMLIVIWIAAPNGLATTVVWMTLLSCLACAASLLLIAHMGQVSFPLLLKDLALRVVLLAAFAASLWIASKALAAIDFASLPNFASHLAGLVICGGVFAALAWRGRMIDLRIFAS